MLLTQSRNAMGALVLALPFVLGSWQWMWLFPLLLILASPLLLAVLPGVPAPGGVVAPGPVRAGR